MKNNPGFSVLLLAKHSLCVALASLVLLPGMASADTDLSELFVNGVVTHEGSSNNSGSIKATFGSGAQLVDGSDYLLYAKTVNNTGRDKNSCPDPSEPETERWCRTDNDHDPKSPLTLPDFSTYASNSSKNYVTDGNGNDALTLTPGEYNTVTVSDSGHQLTFDAENAGNNALYQINTLKLDNGKVTFGPGYYWVNSFTIGGDVSVSFNLTGDERAVFFINKDFTVNSDLNSGGSASQLVVISYADLTISSSKTVNGYLYADDTLTLSYASTVSGAVAGQNVKLSSGSKVGFINEAPTIDLEPDSGPEISIADLTVSAGDDAKFTISLSESYSDAITIDYTTSDGTSDNAATDDSDYTETDGKLTIDAGETSATISVPTSLLGSGTFTLKLSNASAGTFTDDQATATITGNNNCISDQFDATALSDSLWSTSYSSGYFGAPRIVDGRLRLTDDSDNNATLATLINTFTGSGNKIELEFDYYSYGGSNYGADGVAVVFSDASIAPVSGGYGGSLGYAQRYSTSGFAGGWLGVGLDEWGNFIYASDGKKGSGLDKKVADSVTLRGSGSGTDGYTYLTTSGKLDPGIDDSTATTPGPGYRYKIVIDNTNNSDTNSDTYVSVKRDTGSGFVEIVPEFKITDKNPDQAAVPANWFLSLTGSTGSVATIHEIDNFKACSSKPIESDTSVVYYKIIHDGSGLTCDPETVTILACTNSDCTETSSEAITLELQVDGETVTSVSSSSGSSGSTTASFSHTTAETIELSIATDSGVYQCSNGSSSSCKMTFDDSGFIMAIPTQTACEDSGAIAIQAVRTDDSSEQCVAAFTNVDKTLTFWTDYSYPETGSRQVTLTPTDSAGNTLATDSAGKTLATSQGTSVPLTFDEDGKAYFNLAYADAGQLTLNASYSDTETGLSMSGNTQFVTVPAKLLVASSDENADCASGDASCSAFKTAGEVFNLTVSAVCDDSFDNVITPNFVLSDIALSADTVAPVLGNPVSLNVSSINISENGTYTEESQTLSEVGVFTITATPANAYLGETIQAATSDNIGRFTPEHFEITASVNGSLVAYNGYAFVYTGQMTSETPMEGVLRYDVQPELTLTAQSASNDTTKNYTDSFMQLTAGSVNRETPSHDALQYGANDSLVALTSNLSDMVISQEESGVITFQYSDTDNYVYTREANALIAPFNPTIDLQINAITDSDGISTSDANDSEDGILILQPNANSLEVRFGRQLIKNSYGSEISALYIPMLVQYWSGSDFTTNTDDNFTAFTTFDPSDCSLTDGTLASETTSLSGSGTFYEGEADTLMLLAPGINNRGSVTVGCDVASWLEYDWDDGGTYTDDPTAQATFGLYRSNDRVIYRRDSFE